MNHILGYSRNQRIGKLTAYLTQGGAIKSCITSSIWPATIIIAQARKWWNTLKMQVIWVMSFTESILIGYGSKGRDFSSGDMGDTDVVWAWYLCYCGFIAFSFDSISTINKLYWQGFYHLPNSTPNRFSYSVHWFNRWATLWFKLVVRYTGWYDDKCWSIWTTLVPADVAQQFCTK